MENMEKSFCRKRQRKVGKCRDYRERIGKCRIRSLDAAGN